MKDWQWIRGKRPDLTEYLIHHTGPTDGLSKLIGILGCGYLKPSFGYRGGKLGKFERRATIRGQQPAVCFTEQPLDCFIASCQALPSRYGRYGVAVTRENLFRFGGRPAMYVGKDRIDGLQKALAREWHYLLAPLSLWPYETSVGDYPLDFTHEREWRCLGRRDLGKELGTLPEDGVPLLLAEDDPEEPAFAIIVAKDGEVDIIKFIVSDGMDKVAKEDVYRSRYLNALPRVRIVSLETVERALANSDRRYAKLETVP